MPLRFIQPARCVVTATSADTVTTASPAGSRPSPASARPNASCVDDWSAYGSSSDSGIAGTGRAAGAVKSPGRARMCSASGVPGANPAHSSPGAMPSASRSASICAVLVTMVWLSGSPANGKPQPLIVWARITEGRSRSRPAASYAFRISARSWPPTSATSPASASSDTSASRRSRAASMPPAASATRALRSSPAGWRRSRWYSTLRGTLQPGPETLAAGPREARLQSPAPAQLVHTPAAGTEHLGELARAAIGDDAVEALPVDVHDPQHVAELTHDVLAERLPHVALVELGVADHDDEALGRYPHPVIRQVAGGRGHRTSPPPRPAPSSPSRGRRCPGSCGGWGTPADRRTRAAPCSSAALSRPRRYWMA